MERIKISRKPRLKNPYLIVAWPGMGEVAFKAVMHLVENLPAEEFAQLLPEDFFYLTAGIVKEGILDTPDLPFGKFYYWKNPALRHQRTSINFSKKIEPHDLIIFLSNAQPDLAKAELYSKKIIYLAKTFKVKMVFSFAAMPQSIDHTQQPGIWFTATSGELINQLKGYNFQLLSEGQISGMNGLFLGFAKEAGLAGICLLGEIPLYTIQIENPKASSVALEGLGKILGIRIDTTKLIEQSQVMEEEINRLLDYLKLGPTLGPIGEEEIEKIKKSLSQLTKLPLSIKDKIEKLFVEAKNDLSKANELKTELDKWNVYKEYEDRFLDLFRKTKDKNN